MKKKSFLVLAFCALFGAVQAQFSERSNDTTNYRLGNRPETGTVNLAVGLDFALPGDENLQDRNIGLFTSNLVNFRYYLSEQTAVRAKLLINRVAQTTRGDVDTIATGNASVLATNTRSVDRDYAIAPGLQQHFGYNNLFDIYVGGDLYLGFSRDLTRNDQDFQLGNYSYSTTTTTRTLAGLGAVAGVNFWVLDLPLSIGVEYNAVGLWRFGGRSRVQTEQRTTAGVVEQDYYTQDTDALGNTDNRAYSSLSRRGFDTNNYVRVMINFYVR